MAQVAVEEQAVKAEVTQILIPKRRVGEMLTLQGIDLSIQGISVKSSATLLKNCEVGVIEVRDVSVLVSENFVALYKDGVPIQMEPLPRAELVGVRSKDINWANPLFCRKCADLTGKMFSRSPIAGTQYFCQTEDCGNRWDEKAVTLD